MANQQSDPSKDPVLPKGSEAEERRFVERNISHDDSNHLSNVCHARHSHDYFHPANKRGRHGRKSETSEPNVGS